MKIRNGWSCWDIMNCDGAENCPAKQQPQTPCWELANEVGDYRRFCGICQDCIVFVLKTNPTDLSKKQINSILQKKVDCALAV